MADVSVIIPAFNEENGIADVIKAVIALLLRAEIIVVDDGSTDQTVLKTQESGAIVVWHPANAGYGASLKYGIHRATHDLIVITNADDSYPIDQIPLLVERMEQCFDMVVGVRQETKQYDSFLKAPVRLLFCFLVEFTVGKHISDINSGLRAFRKSQVIAYFRLTFPGSNVNDIRIRASHCFAASQNALISCGR